MPSLRNVIEGNDSVLGRAFDFAVIGLIIFSHLTYSIETLPNLSPAVTRVLWYLELLTVVAFTTEYALRLIVAENKRRFVFSFFGLIDLVLWKIRNLASGKGVRSQLCEAPFGPYPGPAHCLGKMGFWGKGKFCKSHFFFGERKWRNLRLPVTLRA